MPDMALSWIGGSEIARNVALAGAAFVGSYLAWKRIFAANRQADAATEQAVLARRDHVMELFNRAAGQLSDEHLVIRLAAIYTLREIVENFSDLSEPVYNLLSSYLREGVSDYGDGEPPADVRGIMETVRIWLKQRETN